MTDRLSGGTLSRSRSGDVTLRSNRVATTDDAYSSPLSSDRCSTTSSSTSTSGNAGTTPTLPKRSSFRNATRNWRRSIASCCFAAFALIESIAPSPTTSAKSWETGALLQLSGASIPRTAMTQPPSLSFSLSLFLLLHSLPFVRAVAPERI